MSGKMDRCPEDGWKKGQARKNGWNDDGCGKKGDFPEGMVGFGEKTFLKNEGSLGMENW